MLFVAVSLRVGTIAGSDELRNRSAQTMALLLSGLLAAVMLSIPDQPDWTLGVEYLALAIVVVGVSLVLDRRAGHETGSAVARLLDATNPGAIVSVLLLAAAVVLILGHDGGAYLLAPALVAVLVGGVVNAWLILVKLDG